MMTPTEFRDLLIATIEEKKFRRGWDRIEWSECLKGTRWFATVQAEMARRSGYASTDALGMSRKEFFTVDFAWFPGGCKVLGGTGEKRTPNSGAAVAIEHENYGGGHSWYAFWKLTGVRADLKVLVAWDNDWRRAKGRIERGLQAAPGLLDGDPAAYLVVIGDRGTEDPQDLAFLVPDAGRKKLVRIAAR